LVCHDSALLARVLKYSSFDQMSRDQHRWSSARPDSMPPFVRKGEIGDWRSLFSVTQLARLLSRTEAKLGPVALELWPDVIEEARRAIGA